MRLENTQPFQTYQILGPLVVGLPLDLRPNGLESGMDVLEEVSLMRIKSHTMLSMMLKIRSIWGLRMVLDIILDQATMLAI